MATNNNDNDNLKTSTKRTRTQEQYEELEEEHQGKKQRSVGKVEQQVFAVINDKSRLYVSGTFLGDRIISFFELVQLGSEVALCYVLGQMVIEPLNFCSDPRMISYAFEYVFRIARIMHPDFIPADVLAKEERVLTLLGACCTYNRPDILRLLLECGANANFKEYVNGQFIDSEKKRPIHICSYYGYIECLKILLLHKADFTIEHNRFRPIVICAFRGFTEGIKALVAAGEDINFVSDHGKTVLGYLVQRNHTEALREILKINGVNVHVGMKKTPIIDACRGDNLVCLKLLLDNGGDINYTNDGRCRHALFTAIRYDSKKVIRYLISRSDLDTNVVDSMGRSPIIRSIKADAPNAFWLLFRKHHDATSDAVIAFYSLSQRCRKERINLSMQSVLRSE